MFGININDLQNKVNYAYSAQPGAGQNQYQTGSLQNPDQTSWMAPSSNSDSTLKQGSVSAPSNPSANTGISGGGGASQIPAGDGTAISAVNNGWSQDSGNNQNTNAPTYGSFTQVGGFDQGKLNDPNKHDPKYDWERARQIAGGGGDLSAAVNYYNSHLSNGEQAAKWLGGDKVDFGAGVGPVDVLIGSKAGINQDWWNPLTGDSGSAGNGGNINTPSFGASPNQGASSNFANNAQARFRLLDPAMQQRIAQNFAVRQVVNGNQMPINFNYNNPNQGPPQYQYGSMQPSPQVANTLQQMWNGTFRPPNAGMPQ